MAAAKSPDPSGHGPNANLSGVDVDAAVRAEARRLGFDVVGVARADIPLDADFARYEAFVEAKMAGEMTYLEANVGTRRRLDEDTILAGAKSVICVGKRYARAPEGRSGLGPRIARYARGQDYHNFLRKKLRRLADYVRRLGPDVRARPICDEAPVLERAWARRAGLGFVGKNGLIIAPGQGSFLLLGEVVTTLTLTPDTPLEERCGACTRCLDACPTQAFERPFVLDPRRCIAYLTIESRSVPAPSLRPAIDQHLFGCDECQDVCPYNRVDLPPPAQTQAFSTHERFSATTLADLVELDEQAFLTFTEGSPLHRATAFGLARNAIVVAANEEPPTNEGSDAIVRGLAHPNAELRALAAWAKDRRAKRIERAEEPCHAGP